MDLSNASTEALAVYQSMHNRLNLSAKVTMGSLRAFRETVDTEDGAKAMGRYVDMLEKPWGKGKSFPDPTGTIDNVISNLGNYFLIQAFSSFEFFLQHLIVDMAHFSSLKEKEFKHAHTDSKYNPTQPPSYSRCCFAYAEQYAKNNSLATRIDSLQHAIGLDDRELDDLKKLFEYFRLVRNCLVHSEGMINKELSEYSDSEYFEVGYSFWNKKYARNKAPHLPELERGRKLSIDVTHSIFASAVCFKIAQILNHRCVTILGLEGILRMACYYSILIDQHEYRIVVNSANAIVSNYLVGRYYVGNVTELGTIEALKNFELWKTCLTRYEHLALQLKT